MWLNPLILITFRIRGNNQPRVRGREREKGESFGSCEMARELVGDGRTQNTCHQMLRTWNCRRTRPHVSCCCPKSDASGLISSWRVGLSRSNYFLRFFLGALSRTHDLIIPFSPRVQICTGSSFCAIRLNRLILGATQRVCLTCRFSCAQPVWLVWSWSTPSSHWLNYMF